MQALSTILGASLHQTLQRPCRLLCIHKVQGCFMLEHAGSALSRHHDGTRRRLPLPEPIIHLASIMARPDPILLLLAESGRLYFVPSTKFRMLGVLPVQWSAVTTGPLQYIADGAGLPDTTALTTHGRLLFLEYEWMRPSARGAKMFAWRTGPVIPEPLVGVSSRLVSDHHDHAGVGRSGTLYWIQRDPLQVTVTHQLPFHPQEVMTPTIRPCFVRATNDLYIRSPCGHWHTVAETGELEQLSLPRHSRMIAIDAQPLLFLDSHGRLLMSDGRPLTHVLEVSGSLVHPSTIREVVDWRASQGRLMLVMQTRDGRLLEAFTTANDPYLRIRMNRALPAGVE